MTKCELSDGIFRYTFEPIPDRHFGNNIIAVTDAGRALLIDTAYDFQVLQVYKDLIDCGLELDRIIISHFHDDHMQGLKALPGVPVYGSEHYKTTLELWTEKEEHKYYFPSNPIREITRMDFGKHRISIIPFPGHSLCTLLILINDKYLYVADELMFSNSGKPILPSADPYCIDRHIESLNRLKAYSSHIFIPGHGQEFAGPEKIEKEIDNRIRYFSAILSSSKKLTYEEASRGCACEFLHSEWHEYVYE